MIMEEPLSLRQKYLEIVSKLMAPGAIGVAVLLGTAAPSAASQEPAAQPPSPAQGERVSERLAAIRDAVSAVSGAPAQPSEHRLAWHNWGNGGGGFGFGFGTPWANFGFGRPWSNWNNWRNGWNNWRTGWGNW